MNDIFSSKRFVAYARQHYTDKSRTYGMLIAGMFLLSLAVNYLIFLSIDDKWSSSLSYSLIAGVIMGAVNIIVVVELSMVDFRRRGTRIMSHMIPSSDLEKFLFVIINAVFFWVLYVGIFYLSLLVLHISFDAPIDVAAEANALWDSDTPIVTNILIALFVLSISIFSNTITRKSSLLGYLITFSGMLCLYLLFLLPVWTGWIKNYSGMDFIPYLSIEPYLGNGNGFIAFYVSRIPKNLKPLVETIFMLSAIFAFIATGCYKFKERELK